MDPRVNGRRLEPVVSLQETRARVVPKKIGITCRRCWWPRSSFPWGRQEISPRRGEPMTALDFENREKYQGRTVQSQPILQKDAPPNGV
jgi:hypothetical protein